MPEKKAALFLLLALLPACARPAAAQFQASQLSEDEASFQSLAVLYETATDRSAVVEAFKKFLKQYPKSRRGPDAVFMQGSAHMEKGLEILRQEKNSKLISEARGMVGANAAALAELKLAAADFDAVADDGSKSGLEASARYRLAEAYYNSGNWERALKEFLAVEDKYPKSYIVPESLLGVVYSNIALGRYQVAQATLFRLEETWLPYSREPAVVFAKAVIELNRKNYPAAQKLFSQLNTPEARFFLGKAYLYEGRTYVAAATFQKLLADFPEADFREEAEFLAADSFFHARDFDGAISKYQDFLKKYPHSKLHSAAVFRIGASQFNMKDYPSARSNFQAVIDRDPANFFAPLSQFFIAESYLENKQTRDALFAYTKVTTAYGGSSVAPASQYKMAWCQYLLGDPQQAVGALDGFLNLYPANALAKNAYYLKGLALLDLKKPGEALRAFQNTVDLAPASDVAEQALFMILHTEYTRGNFNNILTSYQFIFKHLPPAGSKWRALSLLYVAEAYMAINLVEDARNIYNTIMRIYPNDVSTLYAQEGLVWCHSLSGDTEAAARAREKLRNLKAAFPDAEQPGGEDALALADSHFNRKDYENAFQLYEAFATAQPDSRYAAAALYRAGLALYRLRYYSQAVETWSRLFQKYPAAPETEPADFQIADILFRAQKYNEAAAAYERILSRYPKSLQLSLAWLRMAQVRYSLKQDEAAIEQARQAVLNFPMAPEAVDAFDLAEAVFDRSPGLNFSAWLGGLAAHTPFDRTSGEALFRLGRRLFEKKDYAGAIANLKKFSVDYIDHPEIKDAQFYLGEAYFQAGEMDNAAGVFDRFTRNYPDAKEHAVALFRLGNAYYNQKKHEEAAAAYSNLVSLYPQSEYVKPALFNLALCYKTTGAVDKAEAAYRKYYNLTGKSDDSLAALWEIYNIQKTRGDLSGALKTLTQIYGEAEGRDDGLEAMYYMGELSADNRQLEEARDYWERLSKQQPLYNAWRLQGLVKLGELYEAEKNYGEAARVYEDIALNSRKPEFAGAAAGRAKALHQMNRAAGGAAVPESTSDTPAPAGQPEAQPAQEPAPIQELIAPAPEPVPAAPAAAAPPPADPAPAVKKTAQPAPAPKKEAVKKKRPAAKKAKAAR
ncbi:MAG TPA: tetratricopeptide repeat protein [Elusimicrobiales bacterium]|nr:tetratricopeptide repeat protein [Elusimicrobiales bacterium]